MRASSASRSNVLLQSLVSGEGGDEGWLLYFKFLSACMSLEPFLAMLVEVDDGTLSYCLDQRELQVVLRAERAGLQWLVDLYEDAAVELPEFMDWFRYMEGVADA